MYLYGIPYTVQYSTGISIFNILTTTYYLLLLYHIYIYYHWLRIITRLSGYFIGKKLYKIQVKFSITYPESLVMVMILSQ
jgi:hypothetical protein